MKLFFCLFVVGACASISSAAVIAAAPALLSTGTSTQTRSQDAAGNYAFAYNEQHATGGSSRSESGSPLGAVGSYSLNVGDGRQRVVKYVADGLGFRAAIATNEPGTAAQAPASTAISSPAAVVAAAPLAAAPLAAAPLALKAPVAVAAPVAAVAHAPAFNSYSTSVNHAALAAPALVAAPALAAPALAAPVLAAPAYAAPAFAAPAYAAPAFAAPAFAAPAFAAPALAAPALADPHFHY